MPNTCMVHMMSQDAVTRCCHKRLREDQCRGTPDIPVACPMCLCCPACLSHNIRSEGLWYVTACSCSPSRAACHQRQTIFVRCQAEASAMTQQGVHRQTQSDSADELCIRVWRGGNIHIYMSCHGVRQPATIQQLMIIIHKPAS